MKRKLILLVPAIFTLLCLHTLLPYYRATVFIARIHSADPNGINALLTSDVSFRHDKLIPEWYSFYLRGGLVLGPFPLEDYPKDQLFTLHVEQPSFFDWILGRRPIRVFGQGSLRWFIASYSKVSYKQAKAPDPSPHAGVL